ncbi:protein SOB FIVE-LIKE 5-like [Salvia divinorum]|uniref:Protein SOB FIVE-LIKE 5-like n=1 Tax=Salvia divinorum TaxID=28513 RepID=A0ABD1GRW7_SALDI
MNTSTSECSSGCESGWTTYLDHLSNSTNPYTHYTQQDYQGKGTNYVHDHDQEADEDLSMVSDASSGPPHPPPPQQDRKQKSKTKEKKKNNKKLQQHSFCLDDTASSPFLQGNAVPHENQHHSFSAAQFEEEKMPKTKMGFFKSSGSLLGRKRQ